MFEPLLVERIENIVKTSPDIEADRLAQELIKQYPEDYESLPRKHFRSSVKNVQKNVSKKLQKLQMNEVKTPDSTSLKRAGEAIQSPSKRLKTDENADLENSDSNRENTGRSGKKLNLKDYLKKRQEKLPDNFTIIHPTENFSNLVGLEEALQDVKNWIFSEDYSQLRLRGLLITGAAGCGKTLLAKAIAGEKNWPILRTTAFDIFQGSAEDKMGNIRKLFAQAENLEPCFVLIEELDDMSGKGQAGSDQGRQDANVLKRCIEEIKPNSGVFVIGTAHRLESVDLKLRLNEVFGETVNLKIPDTRTRAKLLGHFSQELNVCLKSTFFGKRLKQENGDQDPITENQKTEEQEIKVEFEIDFNELAQDTPGYSGKDLITLLKRAILVVLKRCHSDMQNDSPVLEVSVRPEDFQEALKKVKPTAMSGDIITVPEITWKNVGALENIRQILEWKILNRIKHPEFSKKIGLSMPVGVMLFGPPGCGKTMIAKAMANEASLNFLSVRGPELMDKYVGESERNIRRLFLRAKECSPCLIFFDEIDSICEKRSPNAEGGAKVVQQLLAELDGVASRDGVYVMGATNRIDCVDAAFLRGNRFGTAVYVGLPAAEGRLEILKCLTKFTPLAKDVNLEALARHDCSKNFNGADLMELVENATTEAWREAGCASSDLQVSQAHFERVLLGASPSVKESDLKRYEQMADKYDPKRNK